MKIGIASLFAFLMLSQAQAAFVAEVSCKVDGCLVAGWNVINPMGVIVSVTHCVDDNCELNGWNMNYRNGESMKTQCFGTGCFTDGMQQIDSWDRLLSSTTCNQGEDGVRDCLKWGWVGQTVQGSERGQCFENDCRSNGWRITNQYGVSQDVHCKQNDCFKYGWIVVQ